ncbi:MAG: AAA family ATPase [Rhodoferax sp.]|uniref:XrtA/PEP-CTERM system-associated ATPase n=1 Tax=Rhodoferax sp. TaxID=50421 RepID=UPI00140002A7|nr:XrtA/PEP-CTERM system-associated ATPase [Rhodoferax sp.]NDP38752.1 AAA family ATPase [Rhodoferax sp.]
MYETYYGLTSKPFQLNPDPSFYFGSKQHRRAKAYLEYGVQRNEGFIVITGEVGAGKTTIVRGLLASLDPDKVVAANLVTTQLDAEDTLRLVGAAFGVRVKDVSKADVLMALEAYLVNQTSQGRRCLLIVDEAQNLTAKAVEELRMLSNFQFGQQALLQTFLVGQPEFRAILQSPTMQQLRQRVTATCHIGPMDKDETRGYVEHRLKCAGSAGRPSFDDLAFEAIFKASGGIPRRINLTCDRLLLLGFLGNKDAFGAEDVNEVVKEIDDESVVPANQGAPTRSAPDDSRGQSLANIDIGDIDPGKLQVGSALAGALSSQIDGLSAEQYDGRLRRLELSMLRIERINLEVLAMLQKMVMAARKPSQESQS